MTEKELKRKLREIKRGERSADGENLPQLIQSMVDHIGSTDGELRDRLIYITFCTWVNEDRLNPEILAGLLGTCLDQLLFKGIGENGTDTVFTRSFTSLLVALILFSDNKNDFLPEAAIQKTKHRLLAYLAAEKDVRGYVPLKGWAHSVAHSADAFDEIVKNPKLDPTAYPELAEALWNKVFISDSVYVHDEDERLLIPLLEMLERGMDFEIIEDLLDEMPAKLLVEKRHLLEENYWFLVANCKAFLKSFYVKLNKAPQWSQLQAKTEECLEKIN